MSRTRSTGLRRYRPLLRYPRRQWPSLLVILAMTAASSLMVALQPLPLKFLVDNALGGEEISESLNSFFDALALEPTPEALVVFAALVALALTLLGAALSNGLAWFWEDAGRRMTYDLTADLFSRLQRLSLLFHRRGMAGDFLSRLTVDTWALYTISHALVGAPLLYFFTTATVGIAAWSLDPSLTVLSLIMAPALAVSAYYFRHRLKQHARLSLEARARLASFTEQALSAIPLVQAFTAQGRNRRQFDSLTVDAVRAEQRKILTTSSFESANGLATTAGIAVVLFVGGRRVLDGTLSLGTLLVFVAYLRTLEQQIQGLLSLYGKMRAADASVDRVLEILDSDEEVKDPPQPRALPNRVPGEGLSVRFADVSFGYEDERPVLHEVTLEAEPGEMIALVGRTGAGKTTLVSLIPRFFDPWHGSVSFNGIDLRELQVDDVRRQVSLVRQEPLLMPISVAANIAYGRPDASQAEIVEAARAANAEEFIEALLDGYDTVLGERGATLSGGQRQRLAIARALLKDAPILVLDEPTSALDAQTEVLVLEALRRLTEGRTTFVIAHRLSTVQRADRIVVLDEGRIVESGSHEELLTTAESVCGVVRAPAVGTRPKEIRTEGWIMTLMIRLCTTRPVRRRLSRTGRLGFRRAGFRV